MQFKIFAVSLFAAVAAADAISDLVAQLPTCSLSCLMAGAKQIGCDVTDYSCQCSQTTALTNAVTPCIAKACTSGSDLASVSSVSAKICAAVQAAGSSSVVASVTSTGTATAATTTASGSAAASTTASTTATVSKNAAPTGGFDAGMLMGAAALVAMAL